MSLPAPGAQQHIHLMVNRVQPDTGRAWVGSHDYHRIETSLRKQERELGLRIVPGAAWGSEWTADSRTNRPSLDRHGACA